MRLGDVLREGLRRCINCGGFDRPDEGGQVIRVCGDACAHRTWQRLHEERASEALRSDADEIERRFG